LPTIDANGAEWSWHFGPGQICLFFGTVGKLVDVILMLIIPIDPPLKGHFNRAYDTTNLLNDTDYPSSGAVKILPLAEEDQSVLELEKKIQMSTENSLA
jgi:hypothetical protein